MKSLNLDIETCSGKEALTVFKNYLKEDFIILDIGMKLPVHDKDGYKKLLENSIKYLEKAISGEIK